MRSACVVLLLGQCLAVLGQLTFTWGRDSSRRRDVSTHSGVVRGELADDGQGEYFAFRGIPYAAPPTFKDRFKVAVLGQLTFTWGRDTSRRRDVSTHSGVVRGELADDGQGEYFAFRGIPYAAPPTFRDRFKAPRPPVSWGGIFHANRTVQCPQSGVGDEDCLVVNVFTPVKILPDLAPVLVYFHGGSFLMGSGQTKGVGPLVKQDVIVVTVNYRLGVLGFLCLGIDEAPGNAGLKDQVAALEWVQTNILNFGGDPTRVTIYGMSAGGASVELLVLSKMSKGLFQRAIVESASATSVWVTDHDPIATAMAFADSLQLSKQLTKNLYNLVHYFQHEPANKLSLANFEFYSNFTDGTMGFVPCVEQKFFGTKTFLSKSPHQILTRQEYTKVPMMFLYATLEGLFLRSAEYYEQDYAHRMEQNFLDFVPADLIFDTEEIRQEVGKNIKGFYFGNRTVIDNTVIEYLNYFGDYMVMHGLLNSVERHSEGGNPVYLMEFAYKGGMGSYEEFYEKVPAAGHGDVIKHAIVNKPVRGECNKRAVDRVAKLIANYVRFGNPTPSVNQLLPTTWPLVRPDNVSCLYMDNDFTVYEEPHWGRKVFWDKLYEKYRRRIHPVDSSFF